MKNMITIQSFNSEFINVNPEAVKRLIEKGLLSDNDISAIRVAVIKNINQCISNTILEYFDKDVLKLQAANSKGVVLLAKVIATLNPDLTGLTALEKSAYDKMQSLATAKYADSNLLNMSLDSVVSSITAYTGLIEQAMGATTADELITILEGL